MHPNDHVNKGQSSNDVFPTAVHVAAAEAVERDLLPALRALEGALGDKAKAFDHIVKIGRTHLMDAVPDPPRPGVLGLRADGDEHHPPRRRGARRASTSWRSAAPPSGTGLGADPDFAPQGDRASSRARDRHPLRQAPNLFEALAARDGLVEASGALRAAAVSLTKIANDVRWLGSGPRCGIGEMHIPDLQPGSSIMPGKVNPVMSEMLLMVCAQVIGNDATIAWGGAAGNFELNVMIPVMAYNLLHSVGILANACRLFASRCVEGIEPNEARCDELVEQSLAMVTALNPRIGYDAAAAIAQARRPRPARPCASSASRRTCCPPDELARLLDARTMTGQ